MFQVNKPNQSGVQVLLKKIEKENTLRLVPYFGAHTEPFKLGHFYDDDIWLQLPEFISVLFSYLHLHVNLPIPWDLKNNSPN